jgi:hypothetical protein
MSRFEGSLRRERMIGLALIALCGCVGIGAPTINEVGKEVDASDEKVVLLGSEAAIGPYFAGVRMGQGLCPRVNGSVLQDLQYRGGYYYPPTLDSYKHSGRCHNDQYFQLVRHYEINKISALVDGEWKWLPWEGVDGGLQTLKGRQLEIVGFCYLNEEYWYKLDSPIELTGGDRVGKMLRVRLQIGGFCGGWLCKYKDDQPERPFPDDCRFVSHQVYRPCVFGLSSSWERDNVLPDRLSRGLMVWATLPKIAQNFANEIRFLDRIRSVVLYFTKRTNTAEQEALKSLVDQSGFELASTITDPTLAKEVRQARVERVLVERAAEVVAYTPLQSLTQEFFDRVRAQFERVMQAYENIVPELESRPQVLSAVSMQTWDTIQSLCRVNWYQDKGWAARTIGGLPAPIVFAPSTTRVEEVTSDTQSVPEQTQPDIRAQAEIDAEEEVVGLRERLAEAQAELGRVKTRVEKELKAAYSEVERIEGRLGRAEEKLDEAADAEEKRLLEQAAAAQARRQAARASRTINRMATPAPSAAASSADAAASSAPRSEGSASQRPEQTAGRSEGASDLGSASVAESWVMPSSPSRA